MFTFRFKDASVWRYMIASVEKIIDEGVFVATEEGLSLRALDTSHVVMVDLYYPAEAFTEYSVKPGGVEIGVSMGVLARILRRARKEDELSLSLEGGNIVVGYYGRGVRRFEVPQISLVHEKLPEPRISFTVKAKMLASTFKDSIKTLEPIADSVTFKALEDKRLLLLGRGDVASAEVELSLEKQTLLEMDVESADESTCSIEYMADMVSAAAVADVIAIQYSQDAPIRVDMEYPGGGRLTFYVSPRVE